MSTTVGDEVQGGRFGGKEARTRGLPLAAIFIIIIIIIVIVVVVVVIIQNILASLHYIYCEIRVLSPSFRVDQCVILQVLSHEYSGTKW